MNDLALSDRPPPKRRRWTRQQAIILEIFGQQMRPIALEKLHALVEKLDSRIAYSTIFRWMRKMQDDGLASTVEIKGQPARYEATEFRSNHHFYCRRCDEIYRIKNDSLDFGAILPKEAELENYQLMLYGICEKCAPARLPNAVE